VGGGHALRLGRVRRVLRAARRRVAERRGELALGGEVLAARPGERASSSQIDISRSPLYVCVPAAVASNPLATSFTRTTFTV
jgi:hypothetical protein